MIKLLAGAAAGVLGARALAERDDELARTLRAVLTSDAMRNLGSTLQRTTAGALRELAALVETPLDVLDAPAPPPRDPAEPLPDPVGTLVARVRDVLRVLGG